MNASTTVGYADRYDPDTHFDHWYTDATAAQIVTYLQSGDRVLELGSATGRMTAAMCRVGAVVVGVERSAEYLDVARSRGLAADFRMDDIESWIAAGASESEDFDHIVATNVVHELEDLPRVLAGCRRLVRNGGLLHVSLQNPESVHRLTGLALGMLDDLAEVTPEGLDLLTRRIYNADELTALMTEAGFEVRERRGVMLKPFPNHEMARLSEDQLQGLVAVGPLFPQHAAMNYLVGTAR